MIKIKNPILPGFYPDPSICRAGNKFYLVNSSFNYFPGLPIFESENLSEWVQIGNAIDRESQFDFSGAFITRGLFAPTIRYNKGKFYIICTLVDKIGNFFISADNPAGPWSDPIVVEGAEGIDPSLFFDDDGTVWYIGTRPAPEGPKWNGNWEIWVQRIDLETGKLYGKDTGIWRGALKKCIWPEGPHIYKIGGKYLLLHAEGGTSIQHAVCVAACDTIEGEWVGNPCNPILTHRNMGKRANIVNVGHGDLVDTPDGKWWMVCLASRPQGKGENRVSPLGRETFIVPVEFEDGWPLATPDTGKIADEYNVDGSVSAGGDVSNSEICALNGTVSEESYSFKDNFSENKIAFPWLSLRGRKADCYSLSARKGWLRLFANGDALTDTGNTNFFGVRQQVFDYELSVDLDCTPESNETAGIALIQSEKYQYRMELFFDNEARIRVIKVEKGESTILAEKSVKNTVGGSGFIRLKSVCKNQKLSFSFSVCSQKSSDESETFAQLAENCDSTILSTERAAGFVGNVLGLFVTGSNGDRYADFTNFSIQEIK